MLCLVGPYTNINATLRLQSSSFRVNPSLSSQYVESRDGTSGSDTRFILGIRPCYSDRGVNCTERHRNRELEFRDEAYRLFKGAGAVSTWQLELPPFKSFSHFAHASDILGGGAQMKTQAIEAVNAYSQANYDLSTRGGLVAVFDVKNEFGTAWARAEAVQTRNLSFTLPMPNLQDQLPLFARRQNRQDILGNCNLGTDRY